MFMSALFCDITISCPGIHGLNCMLDICNQFACDNFTIFNSKIWYVINLKNMVSTL